MRCFVVIAIISLFSLTKGIGQGKFNTDAFQAGSLVSQLNAIGTQYNDVKGSPYANLQFEDGFVLPKEGEKISGLKIRYNIHTDQFEIQAKDSFIYGFVPLNTIHWVGVNNSKYIYQHYNTGKKLTNSYFLVAVEGTVLLLVKEKRSYRIGEAAKAMIPAKSARFVKLPDDYYVSNKNGSPIKFNNVKELIDILPDNREKLTDLVKKEKLKKAKLKNFVQIIKFYNSL